MSENIIELSNWYQLVKIDELMQGDILEDCPIIIPRDTIYSENNNIQIDYGIDNVIIMSQSCDLVEGHKNDIKSILLCSLWSISEVRKQNPIFSSNFFLEECRRGHLPAYHMIDKCDNKKWNKEIQIVSFRDIWCLPINFIRQFITNIDYRPRLKSPYREHLSQAFARFFMRIGLPADIAKFKSNRDESELIRKLECLEYNEREKILSCYGYKINN